MSAPVALLERLHSLGVTVRADGDVLRVKPASLVPPDLMEELRSRKAEVLVLLSTPQRPPVVDAAPLWHAEEVARRVEADGWCPFWSEVLGEIVVFLRDARHSHLAPAGVVTYTARELWELDKLAPLDAVLLRKVHTAKRVSDSTIKEVANDGQE